jgi:hypothetical protein
LFWNQTHLHAELYKQVDTFPDPVIDFNKGLQDFPFKEKLRILDQRLSTYTTCLPPRHYFKYLFQGICQYYLQEPSYVMCLEKAVNTGLFPEFIPQTILPDHGQIRSERILVIVSFDDVLNVHFTQLRNIHDAITVIVAGDDFEPDTMLKSWGAYDQVFIAGHGEDKSDTYAGHIKLGKKLLKPGMITDAVYANKENPAVLGIFTCGEAFYTMEARSQFDFFIADHQSSVSRFVEMFLYGYLLTYFQSYNVLQAFKAGRMATIFQAKSDPTYQIFTRGVKLQE